MNKLVWFSVVLGILLNSSNLDAQSSYIQVKSEPGISVFLDGIFQGITKKEFDGLIIENVSPGQHTIKVSLENYRSQEEDIIVEVGKVYVFQVSPFVPNIQIYQRGSERNQVLELETGTVKIQSVPVDILIQIPKYKLESKKTENEWVAHEIPSGKFDIIFNWNDKTLKYEIELKNNHSFHLLVNMIDYTIDIIENRPDEIPKPIVNQRLLYKGSSNNSASRTNQGENVEFGDLGKPQGFQERDKYDGKDRQGNGSSYSLEGRGNLLLEVPPGNFNEVGNVKVTIYVDRAGNVLDAKIDYAGTNILDQKQHQQAIDAALNSKFERDPTAPERHRGWITYRFIK